MAEIALLIDYEQLLNDSFLRELMAAASRGNEKNSDGKFTDLIGTIKVKAAPDDDFHRIRLLIKCFIQKHFFHAATSYSDEFWYEKLMSLEKFVTVAMILEAINLLCIKGMERWEMKRRELSLEYNDIPIAYVKLAALVSDARSRWDNIKKLVDERQLRDCEIAGKFADMYVNVLK